MKKRHQLVKSNNGDIKKENLRAKVRDVEREISKCLVSRMSLCFDLFRHSEAAPT